MKARAAAERGQGSASDAMGPPAPTWEQSLSNRLTDADEQLSGYANRAKAWASTPGHAAMLAAGGTLALSPLVMMAIDKARQKKRRNEKESADSALHRLAIIANR